MSHTPPPRYTEALIDRHGLELAARLNAGTSTLPYEVQERLRAARTRALVARKVAVVGQASTAQGAGPVAALAWGPEEGLGLWGRLSTLLLAALLVLGLMTINDTLSEQRARELADVDLALLIDDLPPAAFADPGFIRFLQKDL